jgi:hypothetical protein
VLALSSCVVALVTVAPAQQPKKPVAKPAPAPRPKPTATADAGALDPYDDPYGSPAPASDAGSSPQPVAHETVSDGGQKPSPLNPQPNEFPATAPAAPAPAVDYDRLLADIAALRARVAAVSDSLFHSRLALSIENDADHGKIARLVVSLDDGVVYTAPANLRAEDATTIYDHAVAPGRHSVTVDVDRTDDRDQAFRTGQKSRFVVEVPRDQKLLVEVRIADNSTMAADFPSDRSGKYDLRVRVKAQAVK